MSLNVQIIFPIIKTKMFNCFCFFCFPQHFKRFCQCFDLMLAMSSAPPPADIPSSPGNIPSSHPLMVRHADHSSLTLGVAGSSSRLAQGMGRSQRTLRQLTANSGHTIHVHYPHNRQPNPPLILQR